MVKHHKTATSAEFAGNPDTVQSVPLKKRIPEIMNLVIMTAGLVMSDLFAIGLAILSGFMIRINMMPLLSPRYTDNIPTSFWYNILLVVILWVFCLAHEDLYVRRLPFWRETKRVVRATVTALVFTLAIIALGKLGDEFSRTILILTFSFGLVLLPLGRYLSKNLAGRLGLWNDPVLILGAGLTGIMIAQSFIDDPHTGYEVFGFLDDDPAKKKQGVIIKGKKFRILGGFQDAARIISEYSIKNVIVAAPGVPGPDLVALTNHLQHYTHSVLVVPDLVGMPITGGHVDYLSNDRIIAYHTRNNLANPVNIITKRLFDIIVGTIIFIALLPIIAVIAIAIKVDSPGPVIFAHKRVGHKGKYFSCYKFRSMVNDADVLLQDLLAKDPWLREEWEKDFKLREDPRLTRVGRFLRKTSLDELPQIFNVMKGEMSLVGPRPIVTDEIDKFDEYIREYYMVLPGMTGLWVVSGRNDIEYQERVEMETWYVHNWSLWLDISIMFRTIPVVMQRKGAY